jgi:hypothetical protein
MTTITRKANGQTIRKEEITMSELGQNVNVTLSGNTLTITIDISKRLGPSKSGKTVLIASTNGNQAVAPGVTLGINCYTKA